MFGFREVRRVGHVERLRPELHIHGLRDLEGAEETHVQVYHSGPAHGVAAHVAEPDVGDAREGARVEVRAVVADVPEDFDLVLDLVGVCALPGMFSEESEANT